MKYIFEITDFSFAEEGNASNANIASNYSKSSGDRFNKIIEDKVKNNPGLNFAEAFCQAQNEHPDLTIEYLREIYVVPDLSFGEDWKNSVANSKQKHAEGPGYKFNRIIEGKVKNNPGLSFAEAFFQAQNEHPDLTIEYLREIQN